MRLTLLYTLLTIWRVSLAFQTPIQSSRVKIASRELRFHPYPEPSSDRSRYLLLHESTQLLGNEGQKSRLDEILSTLTSAFPLFVLSAATLAVYKPATLTWVNQGRLISIMLSSVMCGTGLTLEKDDFKGINYKAVPLGVLCQFIIMPSAAWIVGQSVLRQGTKDAAALFLGLCLVGCSPGGTASNLVSLIAKADVALSVVLTTISTLLATIVTPLLVKILVGSSVQVSGVALIEATARVVLLPVLIGMFLNEKVPKLARFLSRVTPFASVLLVSLICGGVVSQNADLLRSAAGLSMTLSVLALHSIGFLFGFLVPRSLSHNEKTARTISIEVGMQNSALAVVLARSIGASPLASLPGALSATAHSCLGSLLAAIWRIQDDRKKANGANAPEYDI